MAQKIPASNHQTIKTMRKFLIAPVFAALCSIASAADAPKPLTVPSADKKTAISVPLSEGWKTYALKDGSTTIDIPMSGVHLQVTALSQTTIDEAAKQVAELIKSQVTKYKVTETKDISVAGSPGKQLIGTGEEADDSDPSNADVYLFTVGEKVFMLCAHGEGDGSVKNRPLIANLLGSIKKTEP
jgi:hypothetical protein